MWYNRVMKTKTLEKRVQEIKKQLQTIGDMRPGSISQQYNVCGKPKCKCKDKDNPQKHGPYHQLSWVHNGKNTSQFIKSQFVEEVNKQLENYKIFRKLTDEWVSLALDIAKIKLEESKEVLKKKAIQKRVPKPGNDSGTKNR
jgi:hypothetical protein